MSRDERSGLTLRSGLQGVVVVVAATGIVAVAAWLIAWTMTLLVAGGP